jgi:hypothetical protein
MAGGCGARLRSRRADEGKPSDPGASPSTFRISSSPTRSGQSNAGTNARRHPSDEFAISQENTMGLGDDFARILGQYSDPQQQQWQQQPQQVEQDFDQVAQQSDTDTLQHGIDGAFRSDQTPPFGNMLGQMFGQADPNQRAGMLNQLIGAVGPAVIGSLLGGSNAMGGGLGGMLGGLMNRAGGGQMPQISPQEAQQFDPRQVEEIAAHAERENPGVIQQMSRYYAQNPQLFKALGGAALAVALGHIAQRNR